jgi:hypothetical protein
MYIDPGFGTVIIQVLIGVAVAIPFILKTYWGRIKNVFRNKREKQLPRSE